MFNERNPYNVIHHLTFCHKRVIPAILIIAGIIILEVIGAYMVRGFIILVNPGDNQINDNMPLCYSLAPFMIGLIGITLFLVGWSIYAVIVIVRNTCIECCTAYNSAKDLDDIEKVNLSDPLHELE